MDKKKCSSCGEAPHKCSCKNKEFTKAVIEIDNPEQITLMRKVVIPVSMGDDTTVPPVVGKYHNVLLYYEANQKSYLYSSDGIPTQLVNGLTDYETAINLPQINGNTLIGDKTGEGLGLQDKLTAGDNITIENDVISATDTTYGPATDTEIGLVKPGDGLEVDANGTMSISDIEQYAHFFDTVADMKAATNLKDGDYARTLGFYSANDGGGGLYKITNTASATDFQETIGSLYANLIFTDKMTTKQFGITESMTDATSLLQSAINLCIANKSQLKIQTNINLTTLQEHIITIDGNIKIDGCNNTIYNNVTGDYHSLFYISGITEIKNLTVTDGTNEPTENTGTDPYYRVDFYLQGCTNSIIENVTINDCIGVWQFICNNCENVKINNNTINYNENYTLSYDRTSIYLNGFNLQCENNILNGRSKARTGIESHGDNILISNNEIKNYRNPIYVVNDHSSNKIHNVNVLNNYSYTERGICVWLTQSGISVDTINILNNTVITTGDWYALYTYDVIADNFTVENINIKNNVIKHLNASTTKEAIRIYPTHVGDNNNVVIKNIDITDNYIKEGGTSYTVNLADQLSGVIIENIYLTNNTFYCNQYSYVAHYVSTNGYINNVYFNNNIIKNNGTSLFNISTGTKNGDIQIHYNDVEKDLTNVAAGNLNINTSIKGIYPVDLKSWDIRNVYYINVQDLSGNTAKTVGAVNNYILYNDTVLSGSQFKKGDIIWNTNPVIGEPIGWISISNANFRIIQNILGGT